MSTLLLQIAGGLCYFSNKLFFAAAELSLDSQIRQKRRVAAWIVYLLGVVPWVIIFISGRNWIAAAVESSGVHAMLMGLILVRHGEGQTALTRRLDGISKLMIPAGLVMSLLDFGGLTSLNQLAELGIAGGFLFGTYYLARSRAAGYLWLLLGNGSAALLMMRRGYYILMVQQLLSIIPVGVAFLTRIRRGHTPVRSLSPPV